MMCYYFSPRLSTDKREDNISNKRTISGKIHTDDIDPPKNIVTELDKNNNIILKWDKVNGADGYIVYHSKDKYIKDDKIETLQLVDKEYSKFNELENGVRHYFKITTIKSNKESIKSGVVFETTEDINYSPNEFFIIQLKGSYGLNNIVTFKRTINDERENTRLMPLSNINQIVKLYNRRMILPMINDNTCVNIKNKDIIVGDCDSKWIYANEQFYSDKMCLTHMGKKVGVTNICEKGVWNKISVADNEILSPCFVMLTKDSIPLTTGNRTNGLLPIIIGKGNVEDISNKFLIFYYINVIKIKEPEEHYIGNILASINGKENYGNVIVLKNKLYIAPLDSKYTKSDFSIYSKNLNVDNPLPTTFYLEPNRKLIWISPNKSLAQVIVGDKSLSEKEELLFKIQKFVRNLDYVY